MTAKARNRWAREPHIRFGDPCYLCGIGMCPASGVWPRELIPPDMRRHGGMALCTRCWAHYRAQGPIGDRVPTLDPIPRRPRSQQRNQVDAAPVIAHLRELEARGVSPRRAAMLAAVHSSTVSALLRRGHGSVRADLAEALLAVE